jgi:hypothetical protein
VVIEFKSEKDFQRLLDALVREICAAKDHLGLYLDLVAADEKFRREYSESWTFWTLTFRAHLDATLFRLIRIYDGNLTSLSLRNLLDTIAARLEVFDVESFRERLKGNPFVDSLASDARKPDAAQLHADIEFASNDERMKKLTIWRNNLLAHRSAGNVVEDHQIAVDYPLTVEDVERLVTAAFDILNRYSYLFHATIHCKRIVGHDDYMFVLTSIRAKLDQSNREIKEQIEKWGPEKGH